MGSRDTTHSYQVDELQTHLACLTANGSASNDCGSYNLVDSVTDVTRLQELPSVHEAPDQVEEYFTFPSPPKDSPHSPNQADNAAVSATVLTDVVDSRSSLSSTSLDRSYVWSSASSNLPSQSLHEYEERLISPLQVTAYCSQAMI